jgi:hypothetical protein
LDTPRNFTVGAKSAKRDKISRGRASYGVTVTLCITDDDHELLLYIIPHRETKPKNKMISVT